MQSRRGGGGDIVLLDDECMTLAPSTPNARALRAKPRVPRNCSLVVTHKKPEVKALMSDWSLVSSARRRDGGLCPRYDDKLGDCAGTVLSAWEGSPRREVSARSGDACDDTEPVRARRRRMRALVINDASCS